MYEKFKDCSRGFVSKADRMYVCISTESRYPLQWGLGYGSGFAITVTVVKAQPSLGPVLGCQIMFS